MASYELQPYHKFHDIFLVGAIEQQLPSILNVGFWIRDPLQLIQWPSITPAHPRQDFLWEHTSFEVFIGVKDEDYYREINLSPSQAWQSYQFEEYRYPEDMPPVQAHDIDLVELKRTHYGLNATLDLSTFMQQNQLKWHDLFVGLSAVLETSKGQQLYAMQHSGRQADFHNKRDWLHFF